MDEIWDRRGLPPDSDRDAIRRAYARKLRGVHPEDDPEGFKSLREAMETALRYAQWTAEDARYEDEHEDADDKVDEGEAFESDTRAWGSASVETPLGAYAEPGGHDRWEFASPDAERSPFALDDERTSERAAFEAEMTAFARCLDDDADSDVDDASGIFNRILASPAMDEISIRADAETWLAQTIASAIPRSDVVIARAIETFGWARDDLYRGYNPAIAAIVGRPDEWNFMAAAASPDDPLHRGWRALTDAPIPGWRMRMQALSSTRTAQASQLLEMAAYEMPGLAYHFEPARADWWRLHLSRARLTFGMLEAIPIAYLLLSILIRPSSRLTSLLAIGFLPVAIAAPYLWLRIVGQRQHDWRSGARPEPPRWFALGWMPAAGALPLLAILAPRDMVGIVITAILASVLALWTFVAQPPGPVSGRLRSRAWRFIVRIWSPYFFFGATMSHLAGGPRATMWSVVSVALLLVWLRGRDAMVAMLVDVLPHGRVPVTLWMVGGLLAFTGAMTLASPASDRFYLAALGFILGWPLLLLLARTGENYRVLAVGWIAIIAFYLLAFAGSQDRTPVASAPKAPVCPMELDRDADAGARAPVPCGAPGSWMTADDYPLSALRDGRTGNTSYALDIDDAGRVTSCNVTASSGTLALDTATCDLMRTRARYLPARDDAGKAVSASIRSTLRWELQD